MLTKLKGFSQNAGRSEFTGPAPSDVWQTSRVIIQAMFDSGVKDILTARGENTARTIAANISMPETLIIYYDAQKKYRCQHQIEIIRRTGSCVRTRDQRYTENRVQEE